MDDVTRTTPRELMIEFIDTQKDQLKLCYFDFNGNDYLAKDGIPNNEHEFETLAFTMASFEKALPEFSRKIGISFPRDGLAILSRV